MSAMKNLCGMDPVKIRLISGASPFLSDEANAQMKELAKKGNEFLEFMETLRTPLQPVYVSDGDIGNTPMAIGTFDRELNIAVERVEEAVMWAAQHVSR